MVWFNTWSLAKLGVISGSNFLEYCKKRDKARIYQMSTGKKWT